MFYRWNVLDITVDEARALRRKPGNPCKNNRVLFYRWNVLDITIDEARNGSREEPTANQTDILLNPCQKKQPLFYLLTHLTPDTRYAAYVKTYTTLQEKKVAQISIIYFTTLPGSKYLRTTWY